MPIVAIALLTALGGLIQDAPAPRVETHSEVRVVRVDGTNGPGRLDADGDGSVTREEFTAPLTSAFDRMDTNGDGRLSTEELSAGGRDGTNRVSVSHVVTDGGEAGPNGHPRVMMFGGPGGSSSTRVFTMRRDGAEGGPPPGLPEGAQVFTFRSDGADGALPPAGSGQTQVFVRRFGGPGGASDMDKDGDGKVSEEEFLAPLRDAFRRMDADGNGFIDDGESPAASAPAPHAH